MPAGAAGGVDAAGPELLAELLGELVERLGEELGRDGEALGVGEPLGEADGAPELRPDSPHTAPASSPPTAATPTTANARGHTGRGPRGPVAEPDRIDGSVGLTGARLGPRGAKIADVPARSFRRVPHDRLRHPRRSGRRTRIGWPVAAIVLIGVVAAGPASAVAFAGPVVAAPVSPATPASATVACTIADNRLNEISGMAPSARHPGILWLHEDSGGGPLLYALDTSTCRIRARLTIAGIRARDLEAVAAGSDAAGRPVLWVGDIGDNTATQQSVSVAAVPEPARLVDQTVTATPYSFRYPDGSHDAEALLADPTRPRLWVVSKLLASGAAYALPPLTGRSPLLAVKGATVGGLITDGAVSGDGSRTVLRDYVAATVYDGVPTGQQLARVALPAQPQGEAVAWTSDGRGLFVASERDGRLWRVELPRQAWTAAAIAADPQPAATPAATSGATPAAGDAGGTAAAAAVAEPGPQLGRAVVAGLLVLAAAVLIVVVERRSR